MSIALFAAYGLLFGSFLTVVVDRVPRGASIVQPGSACGNCGTRLGVVDLVPVFSWVVLRGKCRTCRASIGIEPLVLELLTASGFALMSWHFGTSWRAAAYCVLVAGLLALAWIDLRSKRLPREITYTTGALMVPLLVIDALVVSEPDRIWMSALGAAISLALMGGIYLASRGGMGDGDVRLSPLLGAALGYLNPGVAPVGLFFGFVLGAIVGVILIATRRGDRRTALPFGPFLVVGTLVALFVGQDYVDFLLAR